MNNALSRIAGLLGVAVLGIVIVHSFNRELDGRLTPMELSPEMRCIIDAQPIKLAGAELSSIADERARLVLKQAIDESFVFGVRVVMSSSLVLALASAFCLCDDRAQVKEKLPEAVEITDHGGTENTE